LKYWRGYLVTAILCVFAWGLAKFAETHTILVDMIYPYVSRMIMGTLAEWSAPVDFCLWQLFAVVLVAGVVVTLVLMVLLKWNPIQWFGWVTTVAGVVVLLHTAIFGLNYYAGPLAEDIRLEVVDYSVTELEKTTVYYRNMANKLAKQIQRDSEGNPSYDSFRELAEKAGEGFRVLTYRDNMAVFAGSTVPVKELGWSDMYTSMGITGFTFGVTGEAAVNPQTPAVSLPFTMCHEMAHRMSIAVERDANLAAFLACDANPDVQFQYSAYFMAYKYCYNALASDSTSTAKAALKRVDNGVNDLLRADLESYSAFFEQKKDEQATQLANQVNDTYLKTSGDEEGVASYSEVCDLLVSWYIQTNEIELDVEEEIIFDPLDETQVDIFPTEPEATEAE